MPMRHGFVAAHVRQALNNQIHDLVRGGQRHKQPDIGALAPVALRDDADHRTTGW